MTFLPSAVTMMNLTFGSLSLVSIINHQFHLAAVFILAAVVMDSMDGKLARKLNAAGEFGKELDSLCDMISFGVAPALLVLATKAPLIVPGGPRLVHYLAVAICLGFIICGAYRLARFNVLNIHDYYVGIPITVAGMVVALVYLVIPGISDLYMMILVVLLSGLMVSRITVPKL